MLWLIEKGTFEQMAAAVESGYISKPEEQDAYAAAFDTVGGSRIMAVASGNANINVSGVLTDAPNIMARIFGGGNTTYAEIRGAIATAEADPDVKDIKIQFNSPGGSASSEMVETFKAIRSATKPTVAFVGNMAASAAFGLASQADKIVAQNEMSKVGSVGVMVQSFVNPNVVTTTSSNAPDKRPDPTTAEGKAKIQAMIDPMEKVFIDAIADGRGISADTVKQDFGKGAVVLAEQALRRNMIDSIADAGTAPKGAAKAEAVTQTETATGGKKEESNMDIQTLKADHSAVYQAVLDEGKKQERDRVSAHLTYGTKCNCMDIASKAIEDGSEVTQGLMAQYMTAGINKRDVDTRAEDETEAAAAADGAAEAKTEAESKEETEDKVMNEALAQAGINIEEKGQ
jgi:ClpP class serine protease